MDSRMNNRQPALLSLAMLILVLPSAAAQPPDSCLQTSTALVLSGGGSAGMAHVGVIRALETLGARPDLVVGTSIGAVVGAMYASGYNGSQLDSLVRVLPLDGLFSGYEPRLPRPLMEWPPLAVLEQRKGGFTLDLSVTREREANTLLSYWLLRGNLEAGGDFDNLPLPFRAVATDLASMEPVVLSGGDLARAVRASISIPLVFRPVEIDGHWLVDGGLSANIPIEIARHLGAERVIVSDVTEHLQADTLDLELVKNVAKVLTSSLFDQKDITLSPNDVYIRPDVDGFPKLDFSLDNKSALIERGYAAAVQALSKYSCVARSTNETSATTLLSWRGRADNGDLDDVVRSPHESPEDPRVKDEYWSRLQPTVLELGTQERYEAVWLNPEVVGDSVLLRPQTVAAAHRFLGLGLAYDNELGVRTWFGGLDRRLIGNRAVMAGLVAVGRLRQEVELYLRVSPGSFRALIPMLSIGLARESIRWFDLSGWQRPALTVRELYGFLGAERNLGADWIAASGFELRVWDEAAGVQSSAGLGAHVAKVPESEALRLRADASWTTNYARFAIEVAWPLQVTGGRVTPSVLYGWGRGLPPQLQFPLGGSDGFPGLHIGERRGDLEALLRLSASYPLAGPIGVWLDLASGSTGESDVLVPRGRWLLGARVGVSLDIGFCPIKVAYGWADGGRGALFFRLGKWF